MTYRHGVYVSEVPTSIVPPVRVDAATPFFIGTAPIHLIAKTADEAAALTNKAFIAYTYAEAVSALGFIRDSDTWKKYSLCECMYSQFALYGVAPAIFVNVLDVSTHKTTVASASKTITSKQVNLGHDVLRWTIEVKATAEGAALTLDTDYSVTYDDDGDCILNILDDGELEEATTCMVAYDKADATAVDAEDIIGGYNATTGKYTGLELIETVYPRWRLVPGFIVAPGWSDKSAVAAVMTAKAENINGSFSCMALCDIPCGTGGVLKYSDCTEWKNTNNYVENCQVVCWPMIKLGDDAFHLSVQLAGLMGKSDADYEGTPVRSPSNINLKMDSMVLDDSTNTEVTMTKEQATYLNSQGIVTALNWSLGWVAWGNRTGCYPGVTDPKDSFIPVRRMFQWIGNTLILTYWQKVDYPVTKRLIQTIIASVNIWLNGLAAREWLVGEPKAEFLESENSTADLIDGIIRFHVYITPPVPAREIDFILEFDTTQFETLFSA